MQQLVRGLADWDHEFLGGSRALFEMFRDLGLPAKLAASGWEPVTPRNVLLFPLSIVRGIRHRLRHRECFARADVVICPTSFTEPFTVFPWIFGGRTPVLWVQAPRVPRSIRWSPLSLLLRAVLHRSRLVLVSEPQRREWQRQRLPLTNCRVVRFGVPVFAFEPRVRADEPARIGFLGRLHEEKGVDTFLRALALVRPGRRVRVRIGGDGPDADRLRKLARDVVPAERESEWTGHVHDVRDFLENLDLVVVPSRRESFGLVPIEAWERGVPALTSDIETFREHKGAVNANEAALVFRTGDPAHLAERIEWFLEHLEVFRSREHAESLHRIVVEEFSIERMVREFEELFEDAARR